MTLLDLKIKRKWVQLGTAYSNNSNHRHWYPKGSAAEAGSYESNAKKHCGIAQLSTSSSTPEQC